MGVCRSDSFIRGSLAKKSQFYAVITHLDRAIYHSQTTKVLTRLSAVVDKVKEVLASITDAPNLKEQERKSTRRVAQVFVQIPHFALTQNRDVFKWIKQRGFPFVFFTTSNQTTAILVEFKAFGCWRNFCFCRFSSLFVDLTHLIGLISISIDWNMHLQRVRGILFGVNVCWKTAQYIQCWHLTAELALITLDICWRSCSI